LLKGPNGYQAVLEAERDNAHNAAKCSRVTTFFVKTIQSQTEGAYRKGQCQKQTLQRGVRSQNTSYSNLRRHFKVVIFENVGLGSGRSSGIRERQPSPARSPYEFGTLRIKLQPLPFRLMSLTGWNMNYVKSMPDACHTLGLI
jgi:hypothetical protein